MLEEPEDRVDLEIRRRLDSRRIKIKDEDQVETLEEVFDSLTLSSLYKIMRKTGMRRVLGVISTGKESRVYRGIGQQGQQYALKIYLTFTREFKKSIWKYLEGDPRYEGRRPPTTRKLIALWASKEYQNLKKMHKSDVRVPIPYAHQDNIVVMEFIGSGGERAPLLKEAMLTRREAEECLYSILSETKKMVCRARLVHADLSEYNIMVHRGECVIIDVSQAVLIEHPNAHSFLSKDLENITSYFQKKYGVKPEKKAVEEIMECLTTDL